MRPARALSVVLAFAVFAAPLCADHASSRRVHDGKDAAKVSERLTQLGVARAAVERQVGSLTSKDLAYFAADPARVQVVGAQEDIFAGESNNLWYETVFGIAAIVGAGFAIGAALSN